MSRSRKKPATQRAATAQEKTTEKSTEHAHSPQRQDRRSRNKPDSVGLRPNAKGAYFLFGRNSVEAALKNSDRKCVRLIGTEKALSDKSIINIRPNLRTEVAPDADIIASAVPEGSPHQGLLLEVRNLPGMHIEDLKPIDGQPNIILMLDQVTDPHNVGACMRSAAAFGAKALITQDRNSPSESGVLARAAAGGLEQLPWLQVPNLSHSLEKLRAMGYWNVGLDGNTKMSIRDVSLGENIVIVMGSEGSGLRPLVKRNCDVIAKIPMAGAIESLNVSNAAAIALYELGK